jgi:hypothetical protein
MVWKCGWWCLCGVSKTKLNSQQKSPVERSTFQIGLSECLTLLQRSISDAHFSNLHWWWSANKSLQVEMGRVYLVYLCLYIQYVIIWYYMYIWVSMTQTIADLSDAGRASSMPSRTNRVKPCIRIRLPRCKPKPDGRQVDNFDSAHWAEDQMSYAVTQQPRSVQIDHNTNFQEKNKLQRSSGQVLYHTAPIPLDTKGFYYCRTASVGSCWSLPRGSGEKPARQHRRKSPAHILQMRSSIAPDKSWWKTQGILIRSKVSLSNAWAPPKKYYTSITKAILLYYSTLFSLLTVELLTIQVHGSPNYH